MSQKSNLTHFNKTCFFITRIFIIKTGISWAESFKIVKEVHNDFTQRKNSFEHDALVVNVVLSGILSPSFLKKQDNITLLAQYRETWKKIVWRMMSNQGEAMQWWWWWSFTQYAKCWQNSSIKFFFSMLWFESQKKTCLPSIETWFQKDMYPELLQFLGRKAHDIQKLYFCLEAEN